MIEKLKDYILLFPPTKDKLFHIEGKGLYIDTHKTWVDSEKTYGTIIGIDKITSGNQTYSKLQRLPLKVDVYCFVSNGNEDKVLIESSYGDDELTWANKDGEETAKTLCELSGLKHVIIYDDTDTTTTYNKVISYKIGNELVENLVNKYVPSNSVIEVRINKREN